MEPILDLEKVSRIDGVKGYYLVKHDGSLVAHKGDNAPEVSSCIALSGLNGDAICSLLGCSHFNYLVFSRQSKESIIVFPMNKHFLAIVKEAHAVTANLIQKISELTDATKTKHAG